MTSAVAVVQRVVLSQLNDFRPLQTPADANGFETRRRSLRGGDRTGNSAPFDEAPQLWLFFTLSGTNTNALGFPQRRRLLRIGKGHVATVHQGGDMLELWLMDVSTLTHLSASCHRPLL